MTLLTARGGCLGGRPMGRWKLWAGRLACEWSPKGEGATDPHKHLHGPPLVARRGLAHGGLASASRGPLTTQASTSGPCSCSSQRCRRRLPTGSTPLRSARPRSTTRSSGGRPCAGRGPSGWLPGPRGHVGSCRMKTGVGAPCPTSAQGCSGPSKAGGREERSLRVSLGHPDQAWMLLSLPSPPVLSGGYTRWGEMGVGIWGALPTRAQLTVRAGVAPQDFWGTFNLCPSADCVQGRS